MTAELFGARSRDRRAASSAATCRSGWRAAKTPKDRRRIVDDHGNRGFRRRAAIFPIPEPSVLAVVATPLE